VSDFPVFNPDDDVQVEVVEHEVAETERSVARRVALQVLYEVDLAQHNYEAVMEERLQVVDINKQERRYVRLLVGGVVNHQDALDKIIQQYAPEWPLDQVAIVDRNILRMALFEFAVAADTPVGVAIDEAVELAKLFGAESTPRFVNGVLGALAQDEAVVRKLLIPSNGENEE
jgi:transcription antitermination protein NusB